MFLKSALWDTPDKDLNEKMNVKSAFDTHR